MSYVDVTGPQGQTLFKYDAERQLVQIKVKGLGLLTVDLTHYQQPPPAQQDGANEAAVAAKGIDPSAFAFKIRPGRVWDDPMMEAYFQLYSTNGRMLLTM